MERSLPIESSKKGILADSLVFSSSRYVLLGLSVVRNFVVAKVLGPQEYGYWVIISLVLTYGDQFHFGLRHTGDREIPFLRGQNDEAGAQRVANTIYAGILLLAAVGVVLMGLYVLLDGNDGSAMRMGLIIAALILFSDQMNRFYLMVLRAHKEFVLSSKVESLFEIVRTVTVCGLVVLIGFAGVLVAFLTASLATSFFFIARYRTRYIPRVDVQLLKKLFVLGAPLFLAGLLYILIISLDRVFAGYVLAKSDLGIYGLASLLAQLPLSASFAVTAVLYPRFSESFGGEGGFDQVIPMFSKALLVTSYLAPLLVACVLFVSEFLIGWLLPQYLVASQLIKVLTSGMFFLVVAPLPLYTLMALGNGRLYLEMQFASVAIAVVGYFVFWMLIGNSTGIAIAASASYVVLLLLMLVRVHRAFGLRSKRLGVELFKVCLPALYSIGIVWMLPMLTGETRGSSTASEAVFMIVRFFAFAVLYLPMLVLLNHWSQFFVRVKSLIQGKE